MAELLKPHVADHPVRNPILHFQYTYPHSFPVIAQAWIRKYSLEPRVHLTTTTGITQLDEDRVQFYRRADSVFVDMLNWERVVIDRRNGGSITSELIRPKEDGSDLLFERGTLHAEGDTVVQDHLVFEDQGIKSMKVDFFKKGVEAVLKAILFAKFDQE